MIVSLMSGLDLRQTPCKELHTYMKLQGLHCFMQLHGLHCYRHDELLAEALR